MGRAWAAGHMQAICHHMEDVEGTGVASGWFKVMLQIIVNALHGSLAQAEVAVMAGELQGKAGEVISDVATYGQSMLVAPPSSRSLQH